MRPAFLRALAALALSLSLIPAADAALRPQGQQKISFFATGSPGFLDIEGVTNTISVADDGSKLSFTVPMTSVKTGIDLRDEHMCNEFVQVAQYPNAVLALDRAAVKMPANVGDKTKGTVTGDFNIHGVSQPVSVAYQIQRSNTGYKVTGKFDFDTSKSGIEIPSYLGVTVDSKMRAEVALELGDAP